MTYFSKELKYYRVIYMKNFVLICAQLTVHFGCHILNTSFINYILKIIMSDLANKCI